MADFKVNRLQCEEDGGEEFADREISVTKLLKFVNLNSSPLTTLNLSKVTVTMSQVHQVLSSAAGNLKELNMKEVTEVMEDVQPKMDQIEIKQLEHFNVDLDASVANYIMSIISTENIKYFSGTWNDIEGENEEFVRESFSQFMRPQKQLESLRLSACPTRFLLEDSVITKPFPFLARNIDLSLSTNLEDESFLMEFLETQRSSLRELTLRFAELFAQDIYRMMTFEIKELSFMECKFLWQRRVEIKNPNIEFISISKPRFESPDDEYQVCDLLMSACNATKLKLESLPISFWISLTISQAMKNLKTLQLESCDVQDPFVYPSVEEFEFRDIESEQIVMLVHANKQLKKINLPSDDLNDDLISEMKQFPSIEVCHN